MALAAALIAGWLHVVAAAKVQASEHLQYWTPMSISQELGPLLSRDASIILPESSNATLFLDRAAAPRIHPNYIAIVQVATERDVQETIRYANRHETPFLAVSGGHGMASTLNDLHRGIQINMRKMNHTRLRPGGKVASVGGGALQQEVTAALVKQGKQAVTGYCECTSVIGPLLGGGHSITQSRYGFSSDNLVSARIVKADGTILDVSRTINSDLFWALRGAGHNFGIVTSFDVAVYDVRADWTITTFVFPKNKLQSVLSTWNMLVAKYGDSSLVAMNGLVARNPQIDPSQPVTLVQLIHQGDDPNIGDFFQSFAKLKPATNRTQENISYGNLYRVGGVGLASPACRTNVNNLLYTTSFYRWDVQGLQSAVEIFSDFTADRRFSNSTIMLQAFGSKRVKALRETESALPLEERDLGNLVAHNLVWTSDSQEELAKAKVFGGRIQEAIRSNSSNPHAYVNLAKGDEELAETYGRDLERIHRLQRLKKTYDTNGRFSFYMPIRKN